MQGLLHYREGSPHYSRDCSTANLNICHTKQAEIE